MSPARGTRPELEPLDDRLLPSATVLDLTTTGAQAAAPSGAIVQQVDPQPMGTGHIHAFVRIQGAASGGGTEQGYNTDGRPLQFDEKTSPEFTRSITLGQVPVVNINGVAYREFLLDINQKASSPLLSLDSVRIYLAGAGNLTGYDAATNRLSGLAPVFDLASGSGGGVEVMLNANLSSGLGSGDMALFVPESAFAGASPDRFLYLYSHFGDAAGATANGGYEQWAVPSVPPTQLPPPVGSLSGSVFLAGTTTPVPNAVILLQGTDSQGNTVNLMTTTDANGNFSFANLAAGTYTIIQEPPAPLVQVAEQLGTVNGVFDGFADESNDQFTTIQLGAGQNGVNYIFYDGTTNIVT